MKYLKVKWSHDFTYEPVLIFCELNDESWEQRKVEVFPDGSYGYADSKEAINSALSDMPISPISEIAAIPEFEPVEIKKEEFEALWRMAKSALSH